MSGTTAQSIIQDSLEMIGAYAAGETISGPDATRALTVLNDMLDSWSNESLACYAIQEQSFSLVPGVASYTIGAGGAFAGTRPLKVMSSAGSAYILDGNGNKYLMDVVPRDKFNIVAANTEITSNIPTTLFYDPQYPLGIINVFPTPNTGFSVVFDSYIQLSEFSSISATMSLPLGYALALKTNLAEALWPYFGTGDINPVIARRAASSKAAVKRTNMRPVEAVFDPALINRGRATYNIYRDAPS